MKSLPWFRLYSEAVDDPKLRLLAFEDRWHFVALLCCKCQGILDGDDDEMTRRMVAVKLGLDMRVLDEVERRLSEVDLIEKGTLQPLAWNDRQFRSDNSTERVRAYRKRQQKQQRNDMKRFRNVSETAQDTDTDTDTDKTTRAGAPEKKPASKTKTLTVKDCPDYIAKQVWRDFIESRRANRAPLTPTAWTRIANQLKAGISKGHDPDDMLGEAIERGWRSFKLEWYDRRQPGSQQQDGYRPPKLRRLN